MREVFGFVSALNHLSRFGPWVVPDSAVKWAGLCFSEHEAFNSVYKAFGE